MLKKVLLPAFLFLSFGLPCQASYPWLKVFPEDGSKQNVILMARNPLSGQLILAAQNRDIDFIYHQTEFSSSHDFGLGWSYRGILPRTINSLSFDPTGQWLYAMTRHCELWRSRDNGARWEQVEVPVDGSSCTSMAMTAQGSILINVSDPYEFNLLRSTDNGASWHRSQASDFSRAFIRVIAEDPSGRLFLAGHNQFDLIRSTDDGISWQLLNNNRLIRDIQSIEFAKNGSLLLGTSNRLYLSDADGENERLLYDFVMTADMPFTNVVTAVNDGIHIFLAQESTNNDLRRTRDFGVTWNQVLSMQDLDYRNINFVEITRQGHILLGSFNGLYRTDRATEDAESRKRALIRGTVNCETFKDNGVSLRGLFVSFSPGKHLAITRIDGSFYAFLPPDSYLTSVHSNKFFHYSGPENATGVKVPHAFAGDIHRDLDLAIHKSFQPAALRVHLAGGQARPGSLLHYRIEYQNVGRDIFTGSLKLSHDARLQLMPSDWAVSVLSDTLLEIPVLPVRDQGRGQFNLKFLVPDSIPVGSHVCARVYYDEHSDLQDYIARDYGFEERLCTEVRSSYARAALEVSPAGQGEQGFISRRDSVLSYLLRFRNISRDTAFSVVILDTLSDKVEITSLRLGAASDDYEVNLIERNVLEFRFDDIVLPFFGVNDSASQGFVRFSVELKDGLADGTRIENRASIRFNSNTPVLTNTVHNTLRLPTRVVEEFASDNLTIWPNPVADRLQIRSPILAFAQLRIVDMLGNLQRQIINGAGESMSLNVDRLPPGMYWLTIDKDAYQTTRMFIIHR